MTTRVSDITTAERCVGFSRGVVFLTALLMLEGEVVSGQRPFSTIDALAIVAAIYAISTSVLAVMGQEREGIQFPVLVADMLLITGIIYVAGGVYNEYYLLYYMPILQASVRLNFRDAIASALLSSGLYALVGLSSGPDVLIPTTAQLRAGTFAASAIFMAAFFALLSREAKAQFRRSCEMAELAGELTAKNRALEETTRQLAEAQDSVLKSERLAAIGELAASVGHELRNPLGVIRNAAYYLKTTVGDGDAACREMLELMDSEIAACDRTIGALLDFARPEQAVFAQVDINELVTECARNATRAEGVRLALELRADLPPARADRHQVQQILNNIIDNAYQAMGESGELRVRSGTDGDNGMILVDLADSGPGIAPENLERVFDPLFTTKAKGIGLGLVVCKRLAERQGGELAVRSEPGRGAAFTLKLPRALEAEASADGRADADTTG